MKTIEEKAKAYDEALEIAKKWYNAPNVDKIPTFGNRVIEEIFPELKESEDEKIRKRISQALHGDVLDFDEIIQADAWLEKQGECHISHDDEIMIKQLTEYFTTGHGLQNTNETVVEWLNDVKEKLEKQGEAESNNDDIEAEEKGIREAFNKIEDEKQCKQKPFDYKNQGTQNSHKFNIGDIISNGNVEFRIDNIVKNCVGQDCYFLVDVESEKNGTRYLTMGVRGKTSHMGETTWLCEQVDKSFKKQGEQKSIDYNEELKKCRENPLYFFDKYVKLEEQKLTDKVEPKFKVGDWVVQENIGVYKVIEVCESWYEVVDNKDKHYSIGFDKEYMCHLYTIQDAKDGDVLCDITNKNVLIFNEISNGWVRCLCSVHLEDSCCLNCTELYGREEQCSFAPAIKEQYDLLFQKMKEAGYEWDAEKRVLKKISQRMISAEAKEAMYAKIAWSEEDEEMFDGIIADIQFSQKAHNHEVDQIVYEREIDWLKSLKERIGG